MSEAWTIGRVLDWAAKDLRTRSSTSPRLDAELMLAEVLNCSRIQLIIDGKRPLTPGELGAYRELHKRRRQGEPIAYLRGEREFYGRTFLVDHRVLVPRPETEILVEVALRRTHHCNLCARVLDLCTGSGCVAITLAKERPNTQIVASDLSADALAVAATNCMRLGALVGLISSDLFKAFEQWPYRFDLITANPPYINDGDLADLPVDVRDFEPATALQAGPEGLDLLDKIIAQAPPMLSQNGVLALEVAAGQADAVQALFEAAGFRQIEVERDYGGHERIVSGIAAST